MFLELRKLHSNGAIRGYQLGAKYLLTPTSFEIVDSKQKAGCHMTRSQPFVEYRTATNERKEDFHESKEKFC